MDRRDFLKSISVVSLGLLAPISNTVIEAPTNAQAISISHILKGNGYSSIGGGNIIADIYGFNADSNKFDKIIFKNEFDISKPFHIIYSEYAADDDGNRACFTSSKKNVLITNYKQADENVFINIDYDIDSSVAKRLEYDVHSISKPSKNK